MTDSRIQVFCPTGDAPDGLEKWLAGKRGDELTQLLDSQHVSLDRMNQLLTLGNHAPLGPDFFRYYWLSATHFHPYDVTKLEGFQPQWLQQTELTSVEHLCWGLSRLYTDALLFFGNVQAAVSSLRRLSLEELSDCFYRKRYNVDQLKSRGRVVEPKLIHKQERSLVSEQVSDLFLDNGNSLRDRLRRLWQPERRSQSVGELVGSESTLQLAVNCASERRIETDADLESIVEEAATKWKQVRETATENTRQYLSWVGDLDVYVATSMRSPALSRSRACRSISSISHFVGFTFRHRAERVCVECAV